mmetsp:Transcript_3361/g.12163  ORF Transcript_3361/g.12163 Transcript_3361/m.12163 type:complete len:286 (+) Transcript_3361:142-999(+)
MTWNWHRVEGRWYKKDHSTSIKLTGYSSDWRSCGWEWGLATGPLPGYISLCAGERPSGSLAFPLVPKRRTETDTRLRSRVFGALLCSAIGAAVSLTPMVHKAVRPAVAASSRKSVTHLMAKAKRKLEFTKGTPRSRNNPKKDFTKEEIIVGLGTLAGATLGFTYFPVGRYWADTSLAGKVYKGTTATGDQPHQYRPPIYALDRVGPISFLTRLVTLQWGEKVGTVAADTRHYPLGTVLYIPGYGWGKVNDRGGAIQGPNRLDLYFRSRKQALKFGLQNQRVDVYR